MGRQKIAIAKIPKKNHLQVMFSKRHWGLFKKASELCTLCRVEIAIIFFSPANKTFSFGHLEVDTVIDRFLARRPKLADLNFMLAQLLYQTWWRDRSDEESQRDTKAWWESPIKGLRFGELEQLKIAMEEFGKDVVKQSNKLASEQEANGMALFGDQQPWEYANAGL